MPYSVNTSDSKSPITFTVQDGAIDNTTLSISLIGTNSENYGDDIARNDIHLLENFASITQPSAGTILTGQLWYDKTDNVLRVYKGTDENDWVNLETIVSASAPTRLTARIGEKYFDTSNDKGYIFDGANWKPTGYAGEVTSALSGDSKVHNPTKFGAKVRAIFLKDTAGRVHPCLGLVYVNNSTTNELYGSGTNGETLMAIFNHDAQFTVDNVVSTTEGEEINYYAELNATGGIGVIINKGMNLRDDYISEAVALATEAVQAQKSNALVVGGQVVNASSFFRNNDNIIPAADITYSIGSPSNRYDHIYAQQITLGAGQSQLQFVTDNNAKIGSSSKRAKEIFTYDLFASDDVTVGDDLSVAGNTALTGYTHIDNNLQVTQNITSNATITGGTLTDSFLSISGGDLTGGVNGTFSTRITFGNLFDGTRQITDFDTSVALGTDDEKLPTQNAVKTYTDTANANMKTYVDLKNSQQDLDISTDSGTIDILVDSETLTLAGGDGVGSTATGTTVTMNVDSTVARTNVDETFDQNVIITGNLTVNGTQTTLNTSTLDVEDLNITVGSGATSSSATNGAGLTFGNYSGNPTLTWDHTNSRLAMNKPLATSLVGNVTGNVTGNLTGDVTGDVTGTVSSIANHSTTNLTEGTNLYYTDARADARIGAANLADLNNVASTTPTSGQFLKWTGSAWAPATTAAGVEGLLDLNDVGSDGTNGQVLQTDGSGNFSFASVSSANYYVDGLSFNTSTGVLTASVNGTTNQTVDLDGRYGAGTSNFSGSYNDLSNKPTISAEPGIFSGGGNPTLASGVTAAEIRSLIGAGTSSSDDTGTPAILSNGSTPTLNSGISAAEIRSLIGAGTSSTNTTYTAGGGLTLTGTEFSLDEVSINNLTAQSRRYITGMTFDDYGRVTGYSTASESDQSFSDTNNYANSLSFSGGTLTIGRSGGLSNLTASLDGRYSTATPAITSNGSTPSLNSGISAAEIRTLIGAGTSSSSGVTSVATSNGLTGGTITGTGTIQMSGSYTGTFTASQDVVAYSDERLKDNIETLDGSKVFDMRGVSFNRNDQDGKLSSGVIAQELEEIAPELIHESEDGTKGVAYGNTVGYLIEAIKILKAEVDDLKQQLNEK